MRYPARYLYLVGFLLDRRDISHDYGEEGFGTPVHFNITDLNKAYVPSADELRRMLNKMKEDPVDLERPMGPMMVADFNISDTGEVAVLGTNTDALKDYKIRVENSSEQSAISTSGGQVSMRGCALASFKLSKNPLRALNILIGSFPRSVRDDLLFQALRTKHTMGSSPRIKSLVVASAIGPLNRRLKKKFELTDDIVVRDREAKGYQLMR